MHLDNSMKSPEWAGFNDNSLYIAKQTIFSSVVHSVNQTFISTCVLLKISKNKYMTLQICMPKVHLIFTCLTANPICVELQDSSTV